MGQDLLPGEIDWSCRLIISAGHRGRLGNRLLHFSQMIAYCLEHDLKLVDLAFQNYAEHFASTRGQPVCRFPANLPIPTLPADAGGSIHGYFRKLVNAGAAASDEEYAVVQRPWRVTYFLDDRIARLARRRRVVIGEWMYRNKALFNKYLPVYREFFRPTPEIEASVERILHDARASSDIVVGVHIRHGDYRSYQRGRYFYTADRYTAVLRSVATLFPGQKVRFLICTDEEQEPSLFSGIDVSFPSGSPVEDLYTLAACDFIIGPPSTFSGWASIYGERRRYQLLDPEAPFTLDDFHVFQGMSDTVIAPHLPSVASNIDWSSGVSF